MNHWHWGLLGLAVWLALLAAAVARLWWLAREQYTELAREFEATQPMKPPPSDARP